MSNAQVDKLLNDIKLRANAYIDNMNLGTVTRFSVKQGVSRAIGSIPYVIKSKSAQTWVARVLEDPRVARSQELQKQIGAAYWAVKVAMQNTPADRQRQVDKLLRASCFDDNDAKRDAIAQLITKKCSSGADTGPGGCDAQQYWEIFTQVAPACWIGLLKEQ